MGRHGRRIEVIEPLEEFIESADAGDVPTAVKPELAVVAGDVLHFSRADDVEGQAGSGGLPGKSDLVAQFTQFPVPPWQHLLDGPPCPHPESGVVRYQIASGLHEGFRLDKHEKVPRDEAMVDLDLVLASGFTWQFDIGA